MIFCKSNSNGNVKKLTRNVLMNKSVYQGLSNPDLSKISMPEFYYNLIKPKCIVVLYGHG